MSKKYLILLILILVLQLFLRMQFFNEPLEPDGGGYAYIGQRILAGELAYRDIFDNKPPGIHYANALAFKLFGDSFETLKHSFNFYALLTTIIVFFIGLRLFGPAGGLIASLLYALFSGGPLIDGTAANTETIMVLFLRASLLLYFRERWFLAGLFSGLAFLSKQVGFFNFLPLLLFAVPWNNYLELKAWKKTAWLVLGFISFPIAALLYFYFQGALSDYIFCNFTYNFAYIDPSLIGQKLEVRSIGRILDILFKENSIIWLLTGLGSVYLLIKERSREYILLLLWAIASLIGLSLGGFFFGHYFIQIIPALCLLSALAVVRWQDLSLSKFMKVFLIIVLVFLSTLIMVNQYQYYFAYSPEEVSVKKYGITNFVVARKLAKILEQRTQPDDQLFIWGAEPEIYFYAKRKCASKYIFFYTIFLNKGQQFVDSVYDEVMTSVKNNKPRYVILTRPTFDRLANYVKNDYQLAFTIDNLVFSRKREWGIFRKR